MEWYILVLISALLTAFVSIIRKKLLYKEHASEFLTTTYLFMAIMLLPALTKIDFNIDFVTFLLILIKGIILAAASLLLVKASKHMEISTTEPLRNLSVIFTLFLSLIFLGDKIDVQHGIGLILTITGAYFLEAKKYSISYSSPEKKYFRFMLFHVFLVAVLTVMDKVILKRTTVYTLLILPVFIMTLIMLFYQSFRYNGLEDVWHSIKAGGIWTILIGIILIASDLTYLMAVSMPATLIALIIALRRTSTLISTVIGGELFHDHNLLQKIASSIVILSGVYLIIL